VRDREQLEELTGAVSLGVLAEDTVLATARVLREESLGARYRQTLQVAHQVLEGLSSDRVDEVTAPSGRRRMDTDELYLDAFHAVRIQAPGEPAQDYLKKLANAIKRVLDDEKLTDQDRVLVGKVKDFFSCIGEITLSRANELFDPSRKEPLSWIRMHTTSHS
jgi:hypothetical protein